MSELATFIEGMPKAELHLHLEGTLEPALKLELAARNGLELPYASVDEMRAAYAFDDLASFLAVYYEGMSVLLSVVRRLDRRARFDVDDASRWNVLPQRSVADVHRERADENDECLLL